MIEVRGTNSLSLAVVVGEAKYRCIWSLEFATWSSVICLVLTSNLSRIDPGSILYNTVRDKSVYNTVRDKSVHVISIERICGKECFDHWPLELTTDHQATNFDRRFKSFSKRQSRRFFGFVQSDCSELGGLCPVECFPDPFFVVMTLSSHVSDHHTY